MVGGARPERPAAAERRPALEARRAELRSAWGEIEEIGSAEALYDAARRLRDQLLDQRIVWVAGEHLPTELTLAPEVPGARLAQSLPAGAAAERPASYTVVTRIEPSPGEPQVAVAVRDAVGGVEAVVVCGPGSAPANRPQ